MTYQPLMIGAAVVLAGLLALHVLSRLLERQAAREREAIRKARIREQARGAEVLNALRRRRPALVVDPARDDDLDAEERAHEGDGSPWPPRAA